MSEKIYKPKLLKQWANYSNGYYIKYPHHFRHFALRSYLRNKASTPCLLLIDSIPAELADIVSEVTSKIITIPIMILICIAVTPFLFTYRVVRKYHHMHLSKKIINRWFNEDGSFKKEIKEILVK